MRPLGNSGLEIAPLVFGGNVFGWTIDERTSHDLLDRFVDRGFNGIDTADVYSRWVEGHEGGESETIIGNWLKANKGKRDRVCLFTKVGSDMGQGKRDLSEAWIVKEVDELLRRLKTDHIDLYFSHWPDPTVTHEETLGAYQKLLKAGKIRAIGASNYDADLLGEALQVSKDRDLPRYEVTQPEYNLYDRKALDGPLLDLTRSENIGVVTYFSLASGFLSGKYRSKEDLKGRTRGSRVEKYLDDRGMRILAALDDVSGAHGAKPAEVAIAWVVARDGVTAPIASATSRDQLDSLFRATELELTSEDMARLDEASA